MPTSSPNFSADQQRMLDLAGAATPRLAAKLLLDLAATFWKSGQLAECVECFARSYRQHPGKKIQDMLGPSAGPREIRDFTQVLIDHGCRYSDVITERAMASAALDRPDEVRWLVDYDRFFRAGACDPPPGTTLEAFNRAVAEEVKANLTFYATPDSAIRHTWRNDTALRGDTPALAALRSLLATEAGRYMAALPADDTHPFIASRPQDYDLDGWAVVSTPRGRHLPHTHPRSWANGVYYVAQPAVSRGANDHRGWLKISPPPEFDGPDADAMGWETRFVEPKPGSFVLFPSYFFHATQPLRAEQERICVAFEILPKGFVTLGSPAN